MPTIKPLNPIQRWAAGLRFPVLFVLTAGLFAADLVLPDLLPFIDELLLGAATALIASRRRKGSPTPPPRL